MKGLILLIVIFCTSMSVYPSSNYINLEKYILVKVKSFHSDSLEVFISEIESQSDFKYRKFLKESKKSNQRFQLGSQVYTKAQLIKLLRRGAIRKENLKEFKNYLLDKNSEIANRLTENKLHSLYHLLRKGSLDNYIHNLSCCL